jgi:NTE family protein
MTSVASSRSGRAPLLVDLALQGGGSHGAFTWGVLDRLLEEPWLRIEGISGTSAGAMNAAILVDGYAEGGADGARARLELFWKQVSDGARFSPFRRSPLDVLLGRWTLDTSPLFLAFDLMARVFSPYDLNPRGVNPLTAILADCINFKRLSKAPIKLFVTATNVHTGRGRVFRNAELTPDVLLASACLPTMFQAIEIDGEAYWDGGYAGNPTITPLIRETESIDTILIQVNPVERPSTPRTALRAQDLIIESAGRGALTPPKRKGFGTILLQRAVPTAGAPPSFDYAPEGFGYEVRATLSQPSNAVDVR